MGKATLLLVLAISAVAVVGCGLKSTDNSTAAAPTTTNPLAAFGCSSDPMVARQQASTKFSGFVASATKALADQPLSAAQSDADQNKAISASVDAYTNLASDVASYQCWPVAVKPLVDAQVAAARAFSNAGIELFAARSASVSNTHEIVTRLALAFQQAKDAQMTLQKALAPPS